ncbi:MAG: hypothetical protein ACE5H3_09155, partial [Planctomycetota bacterium]
LPPPWQKEMDEELWNRFQIRTDELGDVLFHGEVDYARGYDEVSLPEIQRWIGAWTMNEIESRIRNSKDWGEELNRALQGFLERTEKEIAGVKKGREGGAQSAARSVSPGKGPACTVEGSLRPAERPPGGFLVSLARFRGERFPGAETTEEDLLWRRRALDWDSGAEAAPEGKEGRFTLSQELDPAEDNRFWHLEVAWRTEGLAGHAGRPFRRAAPVFFTRPFALQPGASLDLGTLELQPLTLLESHLSLYKDSGPLYGPWHFELIALRGEAPFFEEVPILEGGWPLKDLQLPVPQNFLGTKVFLKTTRELLHARTEPFRLEPGRTRIPDTVFAPPGRVEVHLPPREEFPASEKVTLLLERVLHEDQPDSFPSPVPRRRGGGMEVLDPISPGTYVLVSRWSRDGGRSTFVRRRRFPVASGKTTDLNFRPGFPSESFTVELAGLDRQDFVNPWIRLLDETGREIGSQNLTGRETRLPWKAAEVSRVVLEDFSSSGTKPFLQLLLTRKDPGVEHVVLHPFPTRLEIPGPFPPAACFLTLSRLEEPEPGSGKKEKRRFPLLFSFIDRFPKTRAIQGLPPGEYLLSFFSSAWDRIQERSLRLE